MSLSEGLRAGSTVRLARVAAVSAGLALLAACQVSPVYGPTPGASSTVAAELASIYIEEVDDRVSQDVRNRLISAFGAGAGQSASPRYDMRLTVTTIDDIQALTRDQIKPLVSVQVSVSFDLIERSTNRQVARGNARSSATYTQLNQAYANDRAKRDAETRAAIAAADDVRLRVAAILAGSR